MYLRGRLLDKKVFLWSLFFLQVFLIMIFLLFGSFFSDTSELDGRNDVSVQFVRKSDSDNLLADDHHDVDVRLIVEAGGLHANEFIGKQQCFRDGIDGSKVATTQCGCQLDYHGRDCGQPEVLWRAFMTAKVPLLTANSRQEPHKIFYMIRLSGGDAGISLETLEIQLMELIHVVDLFVICDAPAGSLSNGGGHRDKSKSLKHIAKTGFLKQLSHKILFLDSDDDDRRPRLIDYNDGICSLKSMYKTLKSRLADDAIRDDDVLLVSSNDEILNWRAVKYFKWYDHWPQPTRFRLKYTVYGYYWQHPESTRLGSGACQINVLEEVYKSDPARMLSARKPGLIVGDLNHVGGWYCQYCYHPLNIVKKLMAEGANVFLQNRIQTIDTAYVESLIGSGLFVNGKLGLTRLHRFADKYYAPEYITNSSWRYEGILSNVYATYDDEYAN